MILLDPVMKRDKKITDTPKEPKSVEPPVLITRRLIREVVIPCNAGSGTPLLIVSHPRFSPKLVFGINHGEDVKEHTGSPATKLKQPRSRRRFRELWVPSLDIPGIFIELFPDQTGYSQFFVP